MEHVLTMTNLKLEASLLKSHPSTQCIHDEKNAEKGHFLRMD